MENKLGPDMMENSEAKVEQDLWEALLHADGVKCNWQPGEPVAEDAVTVEENPAIRIPYPWNPLSPDAESFFAELDKPSIFADWQEEEISSRSGAFFGQINHLWSAASLQTSLAERFAARIPQNLLATIAQKAQKAVVEAQKAVASSLAAADRLADQLVMCVQDIAPNLGDDDLRVLARPLAYQMRNGGLQDAINSTLAQVPQIEWQQLSEVQQARLSLAIARYAIGELQPPQDA